MWFLGSWFRSGLLERALRLHEPRRSGGSQSRGVRIRLGWTDAKSIAAAAAAQQAAENNQIGRDKHYWTSTAVVGWKQSVEVKLYIVSVRQVDIF